MFEFKIVVLLLYFNAVHNSVLHEQEENKTLPKDMYVVRATVYQVGILSNETNDSAENTSGHQEAFTIYHKNGTNMDLNSIPNPLLTNITAEKMVGLVPVNNETTPWTVFKQLVSKPHIQENSSALMDMRQNTNKSRRDTATTTTATTTTTSTTTTTQKPVEIIKGAAIIPSEAGIQSIALPPLVILNKNLSKIPVPIPNVSVVSYTKVNTLVKSP